MLQRQPAGEGKEKSNGREKIFKESQEGQEAGIEEGAVISVGRGPG